jgi:AcrR family transcriptional regulator
MYATVLYGGAYKQGGLVAASNEGETQRMPAPLRTPRASWIDEGLRALGVGGPDAVRIESLASTLGVTKGGFYGHFDNRRDFLDEMLDTWERVVTDVVIEQVDSERGDAREKLRRLFAIADSVDDMVLIELAVREWARRDDAVAARLRRVDNRRMAFMRSLFAAFCANDDEVEVRSFLAFSIFIANPLISADHGTRSRATTISLAIEGLLR